MSRIFAFLLFALTISVNAQSLPMSTVFKGQSRFEALVKKIKPNVAQIRALPIGQRTAWFGRVFVGTPYKSYTLEIDDHIEAPSVNLNGLDCWTFFEVSLALARMVEEPEESWTPELMLKYIELDRYRGGHCDGSYLSRLHYLEDWAQDNERRGLVNDLTRSLGAKGLPNAAIEMTNGWKGYRYMVHNPEYREGIAKMEAKLRRKPLYTILKENVPAIEGSLRSGDIISIVSKDGDAYATSHVGLALRTDDGVLHFMHASSPKNAGKVIIDSRLSEYLDRFPRHVGIMVARPLK